METTVRALVPALCAAALSLAPLGCGHDDGGGGGDFGDNDRNLVVCLGDSITQGHGSEGAPYPTRLAAYSGKTVLNFGVGAVEASYGAKTVGSALARKPGYVCILFGANDCIHGTSAETSLASLRRIVQACKANKTRPLVATPTPMRAPHFGQSARILRLSAGIRAIAKEEGVPCIDLNAAFGDGEGLLAPDGLHMTDAGNDLIARKFNSRL